MAWQEELQRFITQKETEYLLKFPQSSEAVKSVFGTFREEIKNMKQEERKLDATTTQTAQSAASDTAAQTAPETKQDQTQTSQQEVTPANTADSSGEANTTVVLNVSASAFDPELLKKSLQTAMISASSEPGSNLAEATTAPAEDSLTDTQKDILKIKQAISDLEKLGETLVGDELAALKAKLASLEEKAKQEAEELVQETEEEIQSLADQFYAKTGIRPWGLVIVTALYLAVKLAGTLFPWLK